jgi:GrpB-like predicted nucleotidyltransferase (UPF0157 family)
METNRKRRRAAAEDLRGIAIAQRIPGYEHQHVAVTFTEACKCALYARAKRTLASREWTYVQQYADAKTDVVKEIMLRAHATP